MAPENNPLNAEQNAQPQPLTPVTNLPTPPEPPASIAQPAVINVVPPAPQPQPAVQAMPYPSQPVQSVAPTPANSPGLIVLQWLTYAFWGWTILAMSILTISVLANFITDAETGGFTPYGIAAVLVLLPISIACDVFYSKQEPPKKAGAASIVMVIHAVIFALFGIGAVIAIVFSLVNMFTSSTDTAGMQVSLYSAIIIAVLYAAVFLRTINPVRIPFVRRFFIIFMTVLVGIIAILGIVGPMAHERATRNDRLITTGLYNLKSSIDGYAKEKNKLPDTLKDLDLKGDSKTLVDKDLVKYTANLKQPKKPYTTTSKYSTSSSSYASSTTYYYQLCVTFTKSSSNKYGSSYSSNRADSDGYVSYIDTYSNHTSGENCYKIKTEDYGY